MKPLRNHYLNKFSMKHLSISTFQIYNMLQHNVNTDRDNIFVPFSDNGDSTHFTDNGGDKAVMSEGETIDITPEATRTIDNADAKEFISQMGELDEETGQITQTSVEHDDEIVAKGHQLIGTADKEQSPKDMISSVFGNTDGEHGSVDSRSLLCIGI